MPLGVTGAVRPAIAGDTTGDVSAVGTNTLRRAHQAEQFLQDAEQKLGHTIEIISGIEEARLIYQGVAHSLEPDQKRKWWLT